jgi:hypothetical protein
MVLMLIAVAACRRESSNITGSYEGGVLSGTVVLDAIEGTPEGMEISVRGTGMVTTVGADGHFAFANVPDDAILDFRRSDGIRASLDLASHGGKGSVLIEVGRSRAGKSSGRGNKTKDKREFEGVIRSASAESIVVYTSHNVEVSIGLSDDTVIRKGNELLTTADLVADMRVHVRARKVSEGYVAQQIVVQEGEDDDDGEEEERPSLRQYEGTVVSASATELVINDSHRNEVTFAITVETIIRKGNATVAAADLRPGQRVHVKAEVAADGAATAVQVVLQNTRDSQTVSVSGTVVSVSGADILVTTKTGGVTVQTNATTAIRKKGKAIAVTDVVAGDSLSAKGTRVSENTILASEVEIRGKSGHP